MRVLMVGVDQQTKGGMWTVAENYLQSDFFVDQTNLEYVSTSITGSVPARLLFTAKAILKIAGKFLKNHYDIVHVHMAERGSVYRKNIVISLAKLFRSKVVIHMHGAEFQVWYQSLSDAKQQGVRNILNKADKILILGQYWKDFICSLVAEKDRVCVLHNAVCVGAQNPYNLGATNMLFLGVVGQRKGIFDLLQAVKIADDQLPANAVLTIYGPEAEGRIDDEIKKLELSHRAVYKGWLSSDKKPEVFAGTAVNILPSYNEGLPMTILETMAYGIPNISTNVAAIPEAVNEENGAIICPGDIAHLAREIIQLMNDAKIRKEKSACAFEKVKTAFSIDAHIHKVLDLYRELEVK